MGRHSLRRPRRRWRSAALVALLATAVAAVGVGAAAGVSGRAVEPAGATPTTTRPPPVPPLQIVIPAPGPTIAPPTSSAKATRRPAPTTTRPPRPAASPPAPPAGDCPTAGFGGVKPHVARAGHHIALRFGLPPTVVGGLANRANATSDHPRGLALDFPADRALGDAIAGYVLEHRGELGVTYVIWRQRIDWGAGWEAMADRGSATANHHDHVHVSFAATPGAGLPC